jgi:hypothetical protein
MIATTRPRGTHAARSLNDETVAPGTAGSRRLDPWASAEPAGSEVVS